MAQAPNRSSGNRTTKKSTAASNGSGSRSKGASAGGKSSSQATKNTNKKQIEEENLRQEADREMNHEISLIVLFAIMLILFLCNFGLIGSFGNAISGVLFGLFGFMAYVLPVAVFCGYWFYLANYDHPSTPRRLISGILLFLLLSMAFDFMQHKVVELSTYSGADAFQVCKEAKQGGGVLAGTIAYFLKQQIDTIGSILVILLGVLVTLIVLTERSFLDFIRSSTENMKESMDAQKEAKLLRQQEIHEQKQLMHFEQQVRDARKSKIDDLQLPADIKPAKTVREKLLEKKEQDAEMAAITAAARAQFLEEKRLKKEQKHQENEERRQEKIEKKRLDKEVRENEQILQMVEGPTIPKGGSHTEDVHELTYNEYIKERDRLKRLSQDNPAASDLPAKPAERSGVSSKVSEAESLEIYKSRPVPGLAERQPSFERIPIKDSHQVTLSVAPDRPSKEKTPEVLPVTIGMIEKEADLRAIEEEKLRADQEAKRAKMAVGYEKKAHPTDSTATAIFNENFWNLDESSKQESLERPEEYVPKNIPADHPTHVQQVMIGGQLHEIIVDGEDPKESFAAYSEKEEINVQPEQSVPVTPTRPAASEAKSPVTAATATTVTAPATPGTAAAPAPNKAVHTPASSSSAAEQAQDASQRVYMKPPIELLNEGIKTSKDRSLELRETGDALVETLGTFGVKVKLVDYSQGPSVTRYELAPEPGVKVSKIVGLQDDIKLSLAATDIRIEAPIPGKQAVGIEVPNKENSTVYLRELFESREYEDAKSNITFAVGKDIGGKTIVFDIGKMPHVLIAGATGSGKSVCINTLIMSLIYKADPKNVQMIMIDPKVVELSVYNDIPHLMYPVVTDPRKASAVLHWAVEEMEKRYRYFADMNVRDLKGYNERIPEGEDFVETVDPEEGKTTVHRRLPQIVIIIDELADLMMVCPGEVEESICRLAQLARAAGIHLVVATQRPSVDVITGLIKANMPSRIAFAVSSGTDSRTILDSIGAEKLLGKGDMLFYPQGYPKPIRVQGAFVSDEEVSKVVTFLQAQKVGNTYKDEINHSVSNYSSGDSDAGKTAAGGSAGAEDDGRDEYFAEAARCIIKSGKASIGYLQRCLKIGFNRAARIMDSLSDYGVVGPEQGTKSREILMTEEEFEVFLQELNSAKDN